MSHVRCHVCNTCNIFATPLYATDPLPHTIPAAPLMMPYAAGGVRGDSPMAQRWRSASNGWPDIYSIWHPGFSNSEELNEAWHDVAGYGQVLSSAEMTALVHQHPEFASRCANTDQSFFFGPAKEQLWYVVDWEYRRPALLRQHAGAVWSRLRLVG